MKKSLIVALSILGLIFGAIITAHLPGQVDLTEDRLYSLSEGTYSLLDQLEEPVLLRYFYSRSVEGLPVAFKNHGNRILDVLERYESAAQGMVKLEVVDPRPDTDEEQEAIRAGMNGQLTPSGDRLFFGLQAICADQERNIPFFSRRRENFLEYDISRLIYEVHLPDRPKLGIITPLSMFGTPDFSSMPGMPPNPQASEEWAILTELRKTYQVEQIIGDSLPDDLDVLAIIHPQNLSEGLQFEIDQYLLGGGSVFLCVDPSAFVLRNQAQNRRNFNAGSESSNLPALLSGWGILYNEDVVVGDFGNATPVAGSRVVTPVRSPVWITLRELNPDSPATAQLSSVEFVEPGEVSLRSDSELEMIPLAETSDASGTILSTRLMFATPESLSQRITPDGLRRVLAARFTGAFPTAFPNGVEQRDDLEEMAGMGQDANEEGNASDDGNRMMPEFTSAQAGANLVVLTDVDLMMDPIAVEIMRYRNGLTQMRYLNHNVALVANLIDRLAGADELLELRSQGTISRPFEKVAQLEMAAVTEFQAQLDELDAELNELSSEIMRLQEQSSAGGLVMDEEALQAIAEAQAKEAEVRAEQRRIRKSLREDIEELEMVLFAGNLLFVPILLSAFGIQFFVTRSRAKKSK